MKELLNRLKVLGLAVGVAVGLAVINPSETFGQASSGTGGTANSQSFYVVQNFPLPLNSTAGAITPYTTNILAASSVTNLNQGWSSSSIVTNIGQYWSNNAVPPAMVTYTNYVTNTVTQYARLGPIQAQNVDFEFIWQGPTAAISGFNFALAKSSAGGNGTLFDTNASEAITITNIGPAAISGTTITGVFHTNINLAGAGYIELSRLSVGSGSAASNVQAYISYKKNTP